MSSQGWQPNWGSVELPSWAFSLVAAAEAAGEDVAAGLDLAEKYGRRLPIPGHGSTALRWWLLAAVAAADLTAARILEAHADALAILAEAETDTETETETDAGRGHRITDRSPAPAYAAPVGRWGVFAAEAPGVELVACRSGGQAARWSLDGTKPWCSLGGQLDYALVTARVGSKRRLFAVDLRHRSVRAEPPSDWVSRGLRAVPSGPVHFAATPARPVGGAGWYLDRPGFAWGGIGVAACWYGGASALAQRLTADATSRPDDLAALSAGTADIALYAARTCLAAAAEQIDAGDAAGAAGQTLALRVRSLVASAAETVLTQAGHTLGPSPLAFDERHARRVADLQIYLRQHHAERDVAEQGRRVCADLSALRPR